MEISTEIMRLVREIATHEDEIRLSERGDLYDKADRGISTVHRKLKLLNILKDRA